MNNLNIIFKRTHRQQNDLFLLDFHNKDIYSFFICPRNLQLFCRFLVYDLFESWLIMLLLGGPH